MVTIHDIFETYRREKSRLEVSIEQMKNDLGTMLDKIVLYGAGSAGIAFLHCLQDVGINPCCFADGNPERWGKMCEGLPIIDYREIVNQVGKDALVIVTINTDGKRYCKSFDEALKIGGHTGVHKNLRDAGCTNIVDYTYFRRCHALFQGDKYNMPSCSDVYLMDQHEEDIEKVYSLLTDDYSKDTFKKIIYFRMLDDSIKIPTKSQDTQYFEYDFCPKRTDEIFVDCGAFNGISLKTFLKENIQFEKYFGIEPDRENFNKLVDYVETLPNPVKSKIELFNKAAYDKSGDVKLYSLNGPGSFIADIGFESVSAEKIDNLVGGKVTYIKMNIEGSEIQALKGATQTIKQYKPKLAIAGYHKTWDLWRVPLLIHEICPDYRFYLRSYMNHLSFVFYGMRKKD